MPDLVRAAVGVSVLTHFDPEAGEACALWCAAIRRAVLNGAFELREAIDEAVPTDRRSVWHARIDEAEAKRPRDFPQNGWVVQALQAAWSAIATTPVPTGRPTDHLRLAVEAAVRGGNDTDTVAAIAGGLLGARWCASAVHAGWRSLLHGWPGLDADSLARDAVLAATCGCLHDEEKKGQRR